MALYSRVHTWVTNEVLTASDLNAEFNNILTNSISDSIVGTSGSVGAMRTTVSPGAVSSESLASNVTGEIQRLRYMLAQIIGGAQWYSAPSRSLAASSLAVLRGDMYALGQQISSSCGNFSTTSSTLVDVTNLSVSLTTGGRPVFVGLMDDGTCTDSNAQQSGITSSSSSTQTFSAANIALKEGTNFITYCQFHAEVTGATRPGITVPSSAVWKIYVPSAGTYTYKAQMSCGGVSNQSATLNYSKLIAFEF